MNIKKREKNKADKKQISCRIKHLIIYHGMFNNFYISKSNLANNIKQIRQKKPNAKVCAMVKANAYGVGVSAVVKILNKYVDFFGVSNFDEAKNIKDIAKHKILITGAFDSKHFEPSFSYTCNSLEDIKTFKKLNTTVFVHIKINTGMNRYGISNMAEFEKCLKIIKQSKIVLEGVYTHFATTDQNVETQTKKFNQFVEVLKKYDLHPIIHADNSHVLDKFAHNFDMIRIGFDLYNNSNPPYKPVVLIQSQITQVNKIKANEMVGYDKRFISKKPMTVAIVPVGYADGFDMKYLGLNLNIGGAKCQVLNICMDCFMLDISKTKLKKGDKVNILDSANPLSLYANYSGTSEYEVMCKFGNVRANKFVK